MAHRHVVQTTTMAASNTATPSSVQPTAMARSCALKQRADGRRVERRAGPPAGEIPAALAPGRPSRRLAPTAGTAHAHYITTAPGWPRGIKGRSPRAREERAR